MAGVQATQTTCAYCGVGCGISIQTESSETNALEPCVTVSTLKGDQTHPANHGRLCVKGSALGETLDTSGRLLYPEVDGLRASWDHALDAVAQRLKNTVDEHGPDSIAFYVSGQLLTEDYYTANKLLKGFIGTANIDTNSRLCMSTAVAAHKRVLGSDTVPGCYEDLEQADLVVLTGSNMAWTHPVVYQRIVAAKETRPDMKIVVIDPRRTATAEIADLHLQLNPGSDIWLFDGLLAHLKDSPALDRKYIEEYTEGFDQVIGESCQRSADTDSVAERCGLDRGVLDTFYRWFVRTRRTVTVFSQGINQSAHGVDQASLILYCHLATGRIGKPGASPFSITGQPNAMGGREVGGLANQLAAHMEIDNPLHRQIVSEFWDTDKLAPNAGLKAVNMFRAVAEGKIKFIWIMATNPLVSLPEADVVRSALQNCPHVVVSDCMADTDTVRLAHIKLPAATWGEKNGTVTNSERRISRQRPFLPLPGSARPDWWIISQLANRLGFHRHFAYGSAADIFREHAALSAFRNHGERDFDIGALAELSNQAYDRLAPVQWPVSMSPSGMPQGTARMFSDGRFYTPSGKARFVAVEPRDLPARNSEEYPFYLNTGRIRDQWHTMTRTALSHRLQTHIAEPFAEMHPQDMALHGIQDGQLVKITSRHAACVVRAKAQQGQGPGSLFMPIHWSDCFASSARVDTLVTAHCDPESGQPAFKQMPVSVTAVHSQWHAVLVSRARLPLPENHYWCYRKAGDWHYTVIAGDSDVQAEVLKRLWSDQADSWAETEDTRGQTLHLLGSKTGKPALWFALAPETPDIDENWLLSAMQDPSLPARLLMLGVPPGSNGQKRGALICTCHQVYESVIHEAIGEMACDSIEAIGQCTRAGTNCGSCVPEIRRLLINQ